jgi:membrane protease subunit HflC
MIRLRLLLPILLLLVVVGATCLFRVDRTEFIYLTQFGRHIATYDGADNTEAGLHFKWPWPIQSVQRLDRRLQYFDLSGAELLTRGPGNTIDKTVTVDVFVCWRVADSEGVDRFIRGVGTLSGAQAILGQRINSELGATIGAREMSDLISTTAGKLDQHREQLRQQLLMGTSGGRSLRETARTEYGIDVVDIRLRRLNHPAAVREAIFERIRSERQRKAAEEQARGQLEAARINSDTARQVAELKTLAEATAIQVRGQGDADADHICSEAARQAPEFYVFLKRLEEYQRMLGDGKSTLLLSTHRELFEPLFHPPTPSSTPAPSAPSAEAPAKPKPGG